jgi:hypothetical protein
MRELIDLKLRHRAPPTETFAPTLSPAQAGPTLNVSI